MQYRESPLGKKEVINTTIGELVEAITEIALKAGKSQDEGYHLASLAIEKILKERQTRSAE